MLSLPLLQRAITFTESVESPLFSPYKILKVMVHAETCTNSVRKRKERSVPNEGIFIDWRSEKTTRAKSVTFQMPNGKGSECSPGEWGRLRGLSLNHIFRLGEQK